MTSRLGHPKGLDHLEGPRGEFRADSNEVL